MIQDFWLVILTPWFWIAWATVVAFSIVVTPGRVGRIACHWGLHDTHEVPGFPGRIRVVCVRCRTRLEVNI